MSQPVTLDAAAVLCYDSVSLQYGGDGMRDENGRFVKGHRSSPSTEFQKGQHWRERKPHWDADWLRREYTEKRRSAPEIAQEVGITENGVYYWLQKHGIPRRSTSETRKVKQWGVAGLCNGMFGVCGDDNPNWKGGVTPLRQSVYSSLAWAHAVEAVWERDGGHCTEPGCGKHETNRRKMHVHHDKDFYDHPEARCDPRYLRLVCSKCHAHIHAERRKGGDGDAR